MQNLVYDVKRLVERIREGSYATQAARKKILMLCATQLVALGYAQLTYDQLKGRHINTLLAHWRTQQLSTGTLKNRVAALRWWAEKIGRVSILPKDNAKLGIPHRTYVATTSKAQTLPVDALAAIGDPYVRMSLQLQEAFGLRKETAIKIRPWQADQGDQLVLQASWTKGKVPITVPIDNAQQRAVLDAAKALVPVKSSALIYADEQYIDQVHRYDYWVRAVGLHNMHGLRHGRAQARYEELSGQAAPVAGGRHRCEMDAAQREGDAAARRQVSRELGHQRPQIVSTYVGT